MKRPFYLTINGAANLIGIREAEVKQLVERGLIPHIVLPGGRDIRFDEADVVRWMESNKRPAASAAGSDRMLRDISAR